MVFGSPNLGKPHLKVDLLYQLVPYVNRAFHFPKSTFSPKGRGCPVFTFVSLLCQAR